MVVGLTLPLSSREASKSANIDGKVNRNSVSSKDSVISKGVFSADKTLHRTCKTLNRWAGLKPDVYSLPNGKQYSFSDLDEGLPGLEPLFFQEEEMPELPSPKAKSAKSPSKGSQKGSPKKGGIPLNYGSYDEEDSDKRPSVRYVTSRKVRNSDATDDSDNKDDECDRKRKRKYTNKQSFNIGYDQLGWDMDALFEDDDDDEGGNVLESIVSIHLLQPSQHMQSGALGERIDSVLKGNSSANFMKISRVHADMRNRIDLIAKHVDEVVALEGNEPGKYGIEAANNTKHADVALRMRQIRKVLQSLHWPVLHGDLKRWVRRSAETEQTMRDFVETTRLHEKDVSQVLHAAKHQADHTLATRELTMANVMANFNSKLTTHSDKLHEKLAEQRAAASEAAAELSYQQAQARQDAIAKREAQQRAHRSKVLKLITKKVTEQERVIKHVERSGPDIERFQPTKNVNDDNTKETLKIGEDGVPENFTASDLDRFDDGRYGHLKRIFSRHAEKITELNMALEKNEKDLNKIQQKLLAKFEEDHDIVGKPGPAGKDKKSAKGNRFVSLVPPEMQQRLALRRERDALCKFLNEVTCEDISAMPTDPDSGGSSPAGKSPSMRSIDKFSTVASNDNDDEEEDDDGTTLLQGKITDLMRDCGEIIVGVNRKSNELGYDNMWEFDPKSFQLFFHQNPQRPLLDMLLEHARAALARLGRLKTPTKANSEAEHNLQMCLKAAEEAMQADKDARIQWYEHKKEFRMKNWKAATDKAIESMQQNISAAKMEGRRLSTEAQILLRQRSIENLDSAAISASRRSSAEAESSIWASDETIDQKIRSISIAEANGGEKAILLTAKNDIDIDNLASKSSDEYEHSLLHAEATEQTFRESTQVLEKDRELWESRAEQARQIIQKQEAINDLQKEIQDLRVELGIDQSRTPSKIIAEVPATHDPSDLQSKSNEPIISSEEVIKELQKRRLSQNGTKEEHADSALKSSPDGKTGFVQDQVLGPSAVKPNSSAAKSSNLAATSNNSSTEGTSEPKGTEDQSNQASRRRGSRRTSHSASGKGKDDENIANLDDKDSTDKGVGHIVQKTEHDMPSKPKSRERGSSRRQNRKPGNDRDDGLSSIAEAKTRKSTKSEYSDSVASSAVESDSYSGSESYSSSTEELEELPPPPPPAVNSGRRRSSDMRSKKMSVASQPDLETVVKQCEKSNAVLRRRREATYASFKRNLIKLGLSKEAKAVGAPESVNERQARLQKEMLEQKAALANLNRMVNFWESRIQQRVETLEQSGEPASWHSWDKGDSEGNQYVHETGLEGAKRGSNQSLQSKKSTSSHFLGVFFETPIEEVPLAHQRKDSINKLSLIGRGEKRSSSKESIQPEYNANTALVDQILRAAKARNAEAIDPDVLQGNLLGSILTARANGAVQQALTGLSIFGNSPSGQGLRRVASPGIGKVFRGLNNVSPREFVPGLTGLSSPSSIKPANAVTSLSMSANVMGAKPTMPMKLMPGLSTARFKQVIKSPGLPGSASGGHVGLRLSRQNMSGGQLNNAGDPEKPAGFVDKQDRVALVKFLDTIVRSVNTEKSNHALINQALTILQLFEYRPGYVRRTSSAPKDVFDIDGTLGRSQSTQDVIDADSKRKLVEFLAKVAVAPDPKPSKREKNGKNHRSNSPDSPDLSDFGEDADAIYATQYIRERAGILLHMLSQRSGLTDQFEPVESDSKKLKTVRSRGGKCSPVEDSHRDGANSNFGNLVGQGLFGPGGKWTKNPDADEASSEQKKKIAVSTPSLDALFASLNKNRISGDLKGPKGVKKNAHGAQAVPITLDGAFESAANRKSLSRKQLALYKFQRKLNDRQVYLELDPKDALKKKRGEALLTDEEKRRMVLERQRERHEAAEETRKQDGRMRPSVQGFKDTRFFIGLMGELDNRNAGGVSPPKRPVAKPLSHDHFPHQGHVNRDLENATEKEEASVYHGAFNPAGERRPDVLVTQEMLRHLEQSDACHSLSLLISLREKMQQRHNSFRLAFQALAAGGIHKNKLSKLSFVSAITIMGFKNEDAETLWRYIHSCAGTGKDADISREMTSQEFIGALRYAAPVDSLPQLRERLSQKFGHYRDAFDYWDKDKNGELDFYEFGTLCLSIGCTVEAAKKRFFEMVEHNLHECEDFPKVTVDAFVLSLAHAEGLQVVQKLRRQVCSGWRTPMDAFSQLDAEFFREPLDLTGFRVAVHSLGVSGANAKYLFELAARDENGRVKLEEVVLRILGGLGAHRQRLEEAMRHGRYTARRTSSLQGGHSPIKHSQTLELGGAVEHHGREGLAGKRRDVQRDPYGKRQSRIRNKTDNSPTASDSTFNEFEEIFGADSHRGYKDKEFHGKVLPMSRRESTLIAHPDHSDPHSKQPKEKLLPQAPKQPFKIQTLQKLRQVLAKKFMERGVPLRFESLKFAGASSDDLTIEEWVAMLQGFDIPEGDAKKLFRIMDVDHSGVISREEFNVSLMNQKFLLYDRHANPRQRYVHLQRQLVQKIIPLEIVCAAQNMKRMITKEELVLMFTGIGLSACDARVLFTMISGDFDKVEVPMYEIVASIESLIRRPLLAHGVHARRERRLGSKDKQAERLGNEKNDDNESNASFGDDSSREASKSIPRSPPAARESGATTKLQIASERFPSLIANGVRVHTKRESTERKSVSSQSRKSVSSQKRGGVQDGEESGDEALQDLSPKVSGSLKGVMESTVMKNRVVKAFQETQKKDAPKLQDLVLEAFDKVEARDSFSSWQSSPLSLTSTASPSSPRKRKTMFQDEPSSSTPMQSLRLTEEQLEHEAAKEGQLALRRFDAFNGSTVEFQIAVHLAQDLRRNLILRNRSIHTAWKSVCKDSKIEDDHIQFADFLTAMTKMKIASLDAERIFRVFELAEGSNPPTPPDFVAAMRFVAPVTSILMLRKRLVMRYKSLSGALAHLQSELSSGGDFSVDQFEKQMLCYAGVGEQSARWLFKALDTRHSGFLTWTDLVFGLEHAAIYSQLEGFGIQLHRSAKSIEAGVARLLETEDLSCSLDTIVLERLGLPSGIAAEFSAVLTRGMKDASALTVHTLVQHLSNLGIGRLHGQDAHASKMQGQTSCASKKARGCKTTKPAEEYSEDSSAVSETQLTATILAWRLARRKLIDRFPEGAAQAFSFLDVQGQGEVSFAEWVNRLRSSGLFEKEEAICLFGLVIDWKHSHWIPGVRGSPTINREMFIKSLQRAEPAPTLRDVRARLLDDFGNLPKAFEQIGGGADISFEKWAKSLRSMWILRTEAAQSFATFDVGTDDRVSQSAFMKTMRHPEAAIKLHEVCHQLVVKHGLISRAFEGVDLTAPLKQRDFVTASADLFDISFKDCQALLPCIFPQMTGVMQLADLFESLAIVEEQRHRLLVPFGEKSIEDQQGEGFAWEMSHDASDTDGACESSARRYSVLPTLNFADLSNDWERSPRTPRTRQDRKSVMPRNVTLNASASSSAASSMHLPRLPQSARSVVSPGSLSPMSAAMSPRLPQTARSDFENDKALRVQEWTKRMPKGVVVERELRRKVTGTLDQSALSSTKQALMGLHEKPPEPSAKPKLKPTWLTGKQLQSSKNLLT